MTRKEYDIRPPHNVSYSKKIQSLFFSFRAVKFGQLECRPKLLCGKITMVKLFNLSTIINTKPRRKREGIFIFLKKRKHKRLYQPQVQVCKSYSHYSKILSPLHSILYVVFLFPYQILITNL